MTFEIVHEWIQQGQYNKIDKSVQFLSLYDYDKSDEVGPVVMGDCNTIHENVKILVGKEGYRMGDWNTIHNGVFIMDDVRMGHNCWIGQGSHLDGRGKLIIGNGVSIAFHSHIWSHVARGCLLDGCTLYSQGSTTIIEDDVWMVGDNVHIAPGITLGEKSIIFAHSVVTKDTRSYGTYAGNPAKEMDRYNYWKKLDGPTKLHGMMQPWVEEFVEQGGSCLQLDYGNATLVLRDTDCKTALCFSVEFIPWEMGERETWFDLNKMTYTKRLTQLERDFYAFIKDYKARFVPI